MIPNSPKNSQHRFFDIANIKTDLERRTSRGSKITLASQILIQLGQLTATMVLARKLGPKEYGLIAMIVVVTGFISMFKEMGLSSATIQREQINHRQISALFWINTLLSLATTAIIVASAPLLAWLNGQPQLLSLTMVLALEPLLAGCVTQHAALLQRQMQFGKLSIADIGGLIVGIAVGITAAYHGAGVWALVYMPLARQAVRAVLIIVFCPWLPGLFLRGTNIGQMIRFGRNILGTDFINNIASRMDTFLIGIYCGASAVGVYSRAYQLLLLPIGQINIPFGRVAIPSLSRLAADHQQYKKVFLAIYNKIILLAAPAVGMMITTADWIIRVTLGPGWQQAANIFAILGLAGMTTLLLNPIGWIFISQNRTGDMLRWTIMCSVIRLTCLIIGLQWGLMGVTVAVVVSGAIILPFCLFYLSKRSSIQIKDMLPPIARAFAFGAITFAAVALFRTFAKIQQPIVGLTISIFITAALVLAFHLTMPKQKTNMIKPTN